MEFESTFFILIRIVFLSRIQEEKKGRQQDHRSSRQFDRAKKSQRQDRAQELTSEGTLYHLRIVASSVAVPP